MAIFQSLNINTFQNKYLQIILHPIHLNSFLRCNKSIYDLHNTLKWIVEYQIKTYQLSWIKSLYYMVNVLNPHFQDVVTTILL